MQIKNHIGGIPPRILLDTNSFWIGKINHKKLLHLLARPIIGPGPQKPHKKNQPYLGTSSNRGRASDQHKRRSCIQNQIQRTTSSHKPRSQKKTILSSSRQWIFTGKFIRTKQEGSQSHQSRAISISWLLTITTQTRSTLNPSRQYQA